jgi:hypothetical protein
LAHRDTVKNGKPLDRFCDREATLADGHGSNRNKSDLEAIRTASFANAASGHGGRFPSSIEIVMISKHCRGRASQSTVAVGLTESLCEEET